MTAITNDQFNRKTKAFVQSIQDPERRAKAVEIAKKLQLVRRKEQMQQHEHRRSRNDEIER